MLVAAGLGSSLTRPCDTGTTVTASLTFCSKPSEFTLKNTPCFCVDDGDGRDDGEADEAEAEDGVAGVEVVDTVWPGLKKTEEDTLGGSAGLLAGRVGVVVDSVSACFA